MTERSLGKGNSRWLGIAALPFSFIVLGGGGPHAPGFSFVLEAAALLTIVGVAAAVLLRGAQFQVPMQVAAIVGGTLFLFALQLVPVPPSLWRDLPGRGPAVAALTQIGEADRLRPLSLDPALTWAALTSLMPALAMIVLTLVTPPRKRIWLVVLMLAAAGLSAAIGLVQYAGQDWLFLYSEGSKDPGTGLFANPNHQVDLMLAALLLCSWIVHQGKGKITLPWPRGGGRWRKRMPGRVHGAWFLMPLFMMMMILTGSRAGALLAIEGFAFAVALGLRAKWAVRLMLPALLLLAPVLLYAFYSGSNVGVPDSQRAGIANELRLRALPDLGRAIQTYSPVGSGLGTFDTSFRRAESLDLVKPTYFNHAHNDYLEILIEAGWIGVLLVGLALLAVLVRVAQVAFRAEWRQATIFQIAMGVFVLLVCLHSVVDYPLRTYAVSVVFGFALVILFSRSPGELGESSRGHTDG